MATVDSGFAESPVSSTVAMALKATRTRSSGDDADPGDLKNCMNAFIESPANESVFNLSAVLPRLSNVPRHFSCLCFDSGAQLTVFLAQFRHCLRGFAIAFSRTPMRVAIDQAK